MISKAARRRVRPIGAGALLAGALLAAVLLTAGCAAQAATAGRTPATATTSQPTAPPDDPVTNATPAPASTHPAVPGTEADAVDGRSFVSTAVTGHALVPGTTIRVAFADGMVTASVGCNTISGAVRLEDGTLAAPQLAMTAMGCPDPLGEQDRWLESLLSAHPSWRLNGQTLTITRGTDSITLREGPADTALTGTKWSLTTLVQGETASSVPDGLSAGIAISGGRLSVRTPCTTGSASAEVSGDSIVIGPLALTRTACTGQRAELERQMASVLTGAVRFTIDGSRLTLTHPDGTGLEFSAESAAGSAPPVTSAPGRGTVHVAPPHLSAGPPLATPTAPPPATVPAPATPGPTRSSVPVPTTGAHRIIVDPPHVPIPSPGK